MASRSRVAQDRNGARAGEHARGDGSRGTVLIVDDEQAVRVLVRQELEAEGYRVLEAADGAAALALVEREAAVDLVLLDLWMPVMDGWQFAKVYWGLTLGWSHAPLVAFTAESGVVSAQHVEGLNAVGYLTKPFELDELTAAVERCSRQCPAREEPPEARQPLRTPSAPDAGSKVLTAGPVAPEPAASKLSREEMAHRQDATRQHNGSAARNRARRRLPG